MLTDTVAQQCAHNLKKTSPGDCVAFLEYSGTVYFARGPEATPPRPDSAITSLIQGLYELDPRMALKIVRNRIYCTSPPTEMCWGMVKVAARRLALVEARDHAIAALPPAVEVQRPPADGAVARPLDHWEGARPPVSDADFMLLARRLALTVPREAPKLYERSRPIAALLVSREGELLGAAVNTNARNRTRHAELNLLHDYARRTGQGLPPGARLYVTLKPCRMCAGLIWQLLPREAQALPDFRVCYGEHDPGPQARVTVLDAQSPERRRATPDPRLRALEIERLLG